MRSTELVDRTDGDRVHLGHLTGRTWEMSLEQPDQVNKGIVLERDDVPTTLALRQAVALNRLVSGPSWWLPADAPGQSRSTKGPDR